MRQRFALVAADKAYMRLPIAHVGHKRSSTVQIQYEAKQALASTH
jgi:hypothetical protein